MKWLILLPWVSISYQYPAAQVTEAEWATHIDSNIETFPAWTWSSISRRTHKPFIGQMTPLQIIFSSTTMGKESITPVARMQIQRSPQGIDVHTSVRPHGFIAILLGFFLVFFSMFMLNGINTLFSRWSFDTLNTFLSSLLGLGFFLGILYLAHQIFFSYEVSKIKNFLETLPHTSISRQ